MTASFFCTKGRRTAGSRKGGTSDRSARAWPAFPPGQGAPTSARSSKGRAPSASDPWTAPPSPLQHKSAGSAPARPQTTAGGRGEATTVSRDRRRARKSAGQVLTAAQREAGGRRRPAPCGAGRRRRWRRRRRQPRGTPAGAHEAVGRMGAAIVGTQRRAERTTATRDDGTTNPLSASEPSPGVGHPWPIGVRGRGGPPGWPILGCAAGRVGGQVRTRMAQ